jgi:polysaccharide export outer membrane protein
MQKQARAVSYLIACGVIPLILSLMAACETSRGIRDNSSDTSTQSNAGAFDYQIGPGDQLQIFVWRNPDLTNTVPVRPDGRISSPLVEDLMASGKTPTQLAREIEEILAQYIREPLVTVTVVSFVGGFDQQIRVIGEATTPRALPYRTNMTLLDVMIEVGGVTEFAGGNKSTIVRDSQGSQTQIGARIDDLIKKGDISANIRMQPGDIVIIPESLF